MYTHTHICTRTHAHNTNAYRCDTAKWGLSSLYLSLYKDPQVRQRTQRLRYEASIVCSGNADARPGNPNPEDKMSPAARKNQAVKMHGGGFDQLARNRGTGVAAGEDDCSQRGEAAGVQRATRADWYLFENVRGMCQVCVCVCVCVCV